jgi:3-oxoacyl-[acyl-carrier protein] reductase
MGQEDSSDDLSQQACSVATRFRHLSRGDCRDSPKRKKTGRRDLDLGIAGRTAIVCASSRGLGRGCAIALAENGVDLVLNGRDAASLDATASDIADRLGVSVSPVVGDVSEPEVQAALLEVCPEPDILVNNNGGPPRRGFRDLDREKIVTGVVQNMVTPIELITAVIDGMAARGFGRIVNITSASVLAPIAGLDLSSGARAGLTAFLGGVLRDVADRNVTVNNLLPGRIDTERLQSGFARQAEQKGIPVEQAAAASAAAIPAGRFGTAEEFGQACAFLCSAHAGYITGQNILIDGGLLSKTF